MRLSLFPPDPILPPVTPAAARGAVWLRALLAAAVALPLFAFTFGVRQGRVVFVLYREPKLAAISCLSAILLAALFWSRREVFQPGALLAVLLRPPWRWLALFLIYGLGTVLWVTVPANLFYELSQYFLLLLLVLCLGVWADRDPAVPGIVEQGLVFSVGVASLVGLVQGVFPLAVLSPIDPGSAAANPSFLGYKNAMAMAVLGQLFLLVHQVLTRGPGSRSGRLLAVLLAAELVYLASLKSRTAYVALLGAAVLAVVLPGVRERRHPGLFRHALAGAGAVALVLGVLAADPGARGRAGSVLPYLRHPASYLESDRGTYLLNSLQMVRHNPFGVGFGDWQTQYPVYRLYRRDLFFSASVQVRKAHSDHVQTLAETGWPGFALWIGFWISLGAAPVRAYLRSGSPRPLLLAAQLAAFGIAMGTDYVTEHPYLKLEFLLVAFLASWTPAAAPEPPPPAGPARRPPWAALAVTIVAAAAVLGSVCLVRKATLAATVTERYLTALEHRDRRGGAELDAAEWALLAEGSRAGAELARTPGATKGLSDDYRVLAQTELLLGHPRRALTYARASLRLHPYSPNTLSLLAELLRRLRPAHAARWSRAADYVMNEATAGFAPPAAASP